MKNKLVFILVSIFSIILFLNIISACISYPLIEASNCNISLMGSSYIVYDKNNYTIYNNEDGKHDNYSDVITINKILTEHTSNCKFSILDINNIAQFIKNGYSVKEQTDSEYQIFLNDAKKQNNKVGCGSYYKAVARKNNWTIYIKDIRAKDENNRECPVPDANCISGIIGSVIWNDLIPIITKKDCTKDSDCKVKFSSCSCKNTCIPKSSDSNIDCASACSINESDKSINECVCNNGNCIAKEESVICTTDYSPVCCNVNGKITTKSNNCRCVDVDKGTVLYIGECKEQVCGNGICEQGEGLACPTCDTPGNCGACAIGTCPQDCNQSTNPRIKILPETASLRAKQRLGELGFTITLKEVGQDKNPVYEATADKQGRFLGLFKVKAKVSAEVDAETGIVSKIKKPWWAFMAGI